MLQKSHLSLKPPECRAIEHKFGETCIPLKPKRIIALEPRIVLDPLIALEIEPIGFSTYQGNGKDSLLGIDLDRVAGAKNVGLSHNPSIEQILRLKPDLILSTDYSNDDRKYKLFSAIAPTVSVPPPDSLDLEKKAFFKENLRYIARLVERQEKAEKLLTEYQQRIRKLQGYLGDRVHQIEISVLFYGEGYIWTIDRGTSIAHVLNDIGLPYKSVPRGEWNLSIEEVVKYDADILFIVNADRKSPSFYLKHPLFSSLKAAKNNRMYVVDPESWRTEGILGINKMLDDIDKYLSSALQM